MQITENNLVNITHLPNRQQVMVDIGETFGVELAPETEDGKVKRDEGGNIIRKKHSVVAFKSPGPFTPAIDPTFLFTKENLIPCLMALETDGKLYLRGHSGTGKTALISQIAARLNYNLITINFDGSLMRGDLVGTKELVQENGAPVTKFRYGLIPLGLTLPGTIMMLDEVDACPPETAFVLQRCVSEDNRFLLLETGEILTKHTQNRIAATANTAGMGDEHGLYQGGTNIQNFSFLNRFNFVLEIDYMGENDEYKLIKSKFPALEPDDFVQRVAKIASLIREAFKKGQLQAPITTRDLFSWCEKMEQMPLPMRTAELSFLNRMSYVDASTCARIIQHHIKPHHDDSSKYLNLSNQYAPV